MRNNPAAAAALVAGIALSLSACAGLGQSSTPVLPGADARRGAIAIAQFGCGACHTISGISGARGLVGPPLTNIRGRSYVAGVLVNTPENMARWIQDPRGIDEKTAMPLLGVNRQQAADMTAYLYSVH